MPIGTMSSLSARRAWIEMSPLMWPWSPLNVALRKESVDRNYHQLTVDFVESVALRKESVDRNTLQNFIDPLKNGRSPQGERG